MDVRFEKWWTAHHSDQPEAMKSIASAAFEAGMDTAAQTHQKIRDFFKGNYTGQDQPAAPVGITTLS